MSGFRRATTWTLIIGLAASGCQTAILEPRTVSECRDGSQPTDFTATEQGVFALVRSEKSDNGAPRAGGTQIKEICVDGGGRIGFRREYNQLIGFAGPTTMPLENGNYSWVLMTEDAAWRRAREAQERQQTALMVFYICTFGVGYAAVVLSPWIAADLLHADVSYGPQTMN